MADLTKTVAILFNADTGPALGAIAGLDKSVGGIGDGAGKSIPKVRELQEEMDGLGSRKEVVAGLASALEGLVAALSVSEFIDANIEAEKFERTMVLLKGSSSAAADEFKFISTLANTLGLELFSTANAYANLTAATKGTALEGQNTRFIFEAVASSMSALGKSSADTEGALLAVSQMVSKGNVSMEELRGQLGERLPGAFQVAADAMGLTTAQLVDLVSSGKLATDEFLPKFAAGLNSLYGGVQQVDTFQAAWNRLGNTLKEISIEIGDSGVMAAATKGIEGLAFAIISTTSFATLLGASVRNILELLATGDFSQYMVNNEAATQAFADSTKRSYDALFDVDGQLQKTGAAGIQAGKDIKAGMESGAESANGMKEAAKAVDENLKKLGIDPKDFVQPFEVAANDIQGVIADLVNNPATNGAQMLSGLLVAMDQLTLDQMPALKAAAQGAFEAGILSADQYDASLDALKNRSDGLWPVLDKVTVSSKQQADGLKKTQDETRKATEAAQKYEVELLKIASNEKIATIESKVKLDIAEVEANAKIATAIIDGIGQTYAADVGLIGDLMAQVTNGYTFADQTRLVMAQASNERVEELHQAQMFLIGAQIDYMRAKTDAVSAGNPLVTIQADGLKPHLEAFMWEVLKEIQVKMAYDGGDMLTGGCSL
jgi:tape measure domain-containing protein